MREPADLVRVPVPHHGRPIRPGRFGEACAKHGEKGEVVEPFRVLCAERVELSSIGTRGEPLVRGPQEAPLVGGDFGVVGLFLRQSGATLEIVFRQETLFTEERRADEKRISGDRGRGLIRRVVTRGRRGTEREDLPEGLVAPSRENRPTGTLRDPDPRSRTCSEATIHGAVFRSTFFASPLATRDPGARPFSPPCREVPPPARSARRVSGPTRHPRKENNSSRPRGSSAARHRASAARRQRAGPS